MRIKFYFSVEEMTSEELEIFNEIMNKYFVESVKINSRNGKVLYVGIIRNRFIYVEENKIDQIEAFLNEIGDKKPKKIALLKKDGYQIGIKKVEEGIVGEAEIAFDSAEYIELMPDEITYDKDDKILSTKRPDKVKVLANFAGWEDDVEIEVGEEPISI